MLSSQIRSQQSYLSYVNGTPPPKINGQQKENGQLFQERLLGQGKYLPIWCDATA